VESVLALLSGSEWFEELAWTEVLFLFVSLSSGAVTTFEVGRDSYFPDPYQHSVQ
jgi:hypothetical protein